MQQNNTETDTEDHTGIDTLSSYSAKERFQRAIGEKPEPKSPDRNPNLHGIPVNEIKERELAFKQLVRLGFTFDQIQTFLPCWNIKLSKTQIYEYFSRLKWTKKDLKGYEKMDLGQDPHDMWTIRGAIRVMLDAKERGYAISRDMHANTAPEGFKFRPDFEFSIEEYHFYVEMQLQPLPEGKWITKHRHYIRLYKQNKEKFKVLFFVKHGDLVKIRAYGRKVLKEMGHPDLDPFRYIDKKIMIADSGSNFATDKLWLTCFSGDRKGPVNLVQYLRR